jgi:sulfotransferase family protein
MPILARGRFDEPSRSVVHLLNIIPCRQELESYLPGAMRQLSCSTMTSAVLPFQPIFIVGCQRSGSTMLGAMLGAHPDIVCIPEGQFVVELMPESGHSAVVDPADVIDRIARHWRFRIWEFELEGRRPAAGEIASTYRAAIEWLIRRYGESVGRRTARIWVDQQPGHVLHVWKLLQHFPDAKVVHVVRDGRAVAASVMPLDWGPNEIYSAARYWQQRLAYGYAAGAALGPERMLHVRYEDIIGQTEPTMQRIAIFAGVDFVPAMLSATGLKLPRFTHHQHQLIGTPPQPDRVESWRRTLSRRQIEIFEAMVGDLLPLLGYEPLIGSKARPPTFSEKVLLVTRNELKKVPNAVRVQLRRYRHGL